MDFLDPNKKRSNKIKLYVGYCLIAIVIAISSLILLFYSSGYGLDGKGKVIQNGLVFMSSRPDAAQIYMEGVHNGFKQQAQTNTRMVLKEGQYKVTLQKQGYRSWQREFSLEGSGIERMVYPLLIPTNLQTTTRKTYAKQPAFVTSSPDRQWIVIQQPDNFTAFDVFNANDPEAAPTSFTVPGGILSASKGAQSLELVEWSTDNVNILVKHVYDGTAEFAVINREKPAESFNVTTATGQRPYNVVLKDKKVSQLYLHMAPGGLLQSVDVKTKALSPLVGKALAFQPHGDDMLVYVTPHPSKAESVQVKIMTGTKQYDLRELPANTTYVVDVAKFENNWYVVAGAASDNKVYVYKDPMEILRNPESNRPVVARTLRIVNPKEVSFSANARFLAAQSDQGFAVYDAETDRQYRYDLAEPIDSGKPAMWMDGHRLATSSAGTALIFDFDGINSQKLMPIVSSTQVMFDRDYENSYALAPATNPADGFILSRTKLLVD